MMKMALVALEGPVVSEGGGAGQWNDGGCLRKGGGQDGRRTAFHATAELNVFAFGAVPLGDGGWDVATRLHDVNCCITNSII